MRPLETVCVICCKVYEKLIGFIVQNTHGVPEFELSYIGFTDLFIVEVILVRLE